MRAIFHPEPVDRAFSGATGKQSAITGDTWREGLHQRPEQEVTKAFYAGGAIPPRGETGIAARVLRDGKQLACRVALALQCGRAASIAEPPYGRYSTRTPANMTTSKPILLPEAPVAAASSDEQHVQFASVALVPIEPTQATRAAWRPEPADVLAALFAGRNPNTLRTYRGALRRFAGWLGCPPDELPMRLCEHGAGRANALVLAYRAELIGQGLAPSTINGALAAIAAVVRMARVLGMVAWALDVPKLRAEAYRDTRGPGVDGFRSLLAAVDGECDKAVRDRAILRSLFDLALHRSELVALDAEDAELQRGIPSGLWVRRKGHTEKELHTLPAPTARALAAYLEVRGDGPGALFVSWDRARKGTGRLTADGVWRIVRRLGGAAELGAVRPHGLRHAAITAALDSGADVREAARFSRHARLETLIRYDDNRTDMAGQVAARVAALVE